MPLDQNPQQTVTRFGCVGFSTYTCRFSVPQMRELCLFTYLPRSKWASSEKMIFLQKSASSVSRSQAHLAKRKHIGLSIGFNSWTNWTFYGVIPRSLCKIRINDISEMFNCWERRWIDVDGASLSAALFWLFTLWFIDEDSSFFHFFHKITNIRCFSFSKIRTQFLNIFCNIIMIFKVMSQYFPALFKRLDNHIR